MSTKTLSTYSNYRWLVAVTLFFGLLGLNVLWFGPSPLLTVIMEDLNINMMQGGLMMSIVCLVVALTDIPAGKLLVKIGEYKIYLLALMFVGLGATAVYWASSYAFLLVSRLVVGVGFGLAMPVAGAVIMKWFPEKERSYLNTINSVLPYIATTITFSCTVTLYQIFNQSWRLTLAMAGVYALVIMFFWGLVGRRNATNQKITVEERQTATSNSSNLLKDVLTNREVILISLADAGDMWSFQFLSSYLPTYYTTEAGLSLAEAANLTAIFPIAGILAGILCGTLMSLLGKRKPFTWPLHLMIFGGTFLAIYGEGVLRIIGISMAGFGNAGWAPALFTMPMEFENMTPEKVGLVYATMLCLGYTAAFISPWLGGWLSQWFSLRAIIFAFSFSSLVAAIATFLMKETGPSAKEKARKGEVCCD